MLLKYSMNPPKHGATYYWIENSEIREIEDKVRWNRQFGREWNSYVESMEENRLCKISKDNNRRDLRLPGRPPK